MVQTVKMFTPDGSDTRKWIGRVIIGVIVGEAIWGLVVSVTNNVVVPWLGDVIGQPSRLPVSFTERPYDYPAVLVSVGEFCIAGIVAIIMNHFLHRQRSEKVKQIERASADSARVRPPTQTAAVTIQTASAVAPPARVESSSVTSPAPAVASTATPIVALGPVASPLAVAHPAPPLANSTAKPLPTAPTTVSRLKRKEVYYNIVGEAIPSDED